MMYGDQLAKANKLVENLDLVKDVTIIWLQQTGEEVMKFNFIEERLEGEEDLEGTESVYDLFIDIAESMPRKVWFRINGEDVEVFDTIKANREP